MGSRRTLPRGLSVVALLAVFTFGGAAPAAQAQSFSFALPVELESTSWFHRPAIATGDFNNDSIPDLVTSYGLYLGTATGFAAPQVIGFVGEPIFTADMDRDGNLDVVTNDTIWFGDGTGAFSRYYPLYRQPGDSVSAVAIADFDRDGWPDVAVSDHATACLRILRGDSNGGFAQGDCVGLQLPRPVIVGDFNGDGWADLAALVGWKEVQVLLADGAGGFRAAAAFSVGGTPAALASGDFDGDGLLDLATANVDTATLSVLRGIGDGRFEAPVDYPCGGEVSLLAVGDFNQDGVSDVAVGSTEYFDRTLTVFTGRRAGPLGGRIQYFTNTAILGLVVTDMGGDGIADLVLARDERPLSVFRGRNNGAFDGIVLSGGPFGETPAVAKLDANGSDDLVAGAAVLLATGPGMYELSQDLASGGGPSAIGDFDGDGVQDLVVAGISSQELTSFRGRGDGRFDLMSRQALGGLSYAIASGDFNGDGIPDLAVTNNNLSAGLLVFAGTGSGSFVAAGSYALGGYPRKVVIADFDGDGIADIAAAYNSDPSGARLALLRGAGDGSFSAAGPYLVGGTWMTDMVAADFDGDSAVDVAVGTDEALYVLRGAGDGTLLAPIRYPAGLSPEALAPADFNGDGFMDLAAGLSLGDPGERKNLWVFPGTSAGTFGPPTKFDADGSQLYVAVADADGDGRPDIVSAIPFFSPYGIRTYLNSTPGNRANLSVSVDDGTASATVGYPQAHVVTVTNNGPGTVDAVTLRLHLPPTLLNPVLTPDSGELDANGSWTGLNLLAGDSVALRVTSVLDMAATGKLVVAAHALPPAGSVDFAPANSVAADRDVILPQPSLSAARLSVPEGDSGLSDAVFTVTLSRPSDQAVSVHYATADGTATAGLDYVAASGVLDFAPGVTEQTFNVQIIGDVMDEDDETFRLALSAPQNATLADPAVTEETIVDDDAAPDISIDSRQVLEGDSGTTPVTFHVTLSRPSARTITVSYATSDGSAHAYLDYVAARGVLTFEPGSTTASMTVGVIGDRLREANEDFWIRLSSPAAASLASSRGRCVIVDDDRRPLPALRRSPAP
jgi:hypothetical protein